MKKELVKPNPILTQLIKEVESLCDGFTCCVSFGCPSFNPSMDTGSSTEILF